MSEAQSATDETAISTAIVKRPREIASAMLPPWQQRESCHAERDCGCCGARTALVCVERYEHAGVHAFVCRNCGRDKDC